MKTLSEHKNAVDNLLGRVENLKESLSADGYMILLSGVLGSINKCLDSLKVVQSNISNCIHLGGDLSPALYPIAFSLVRNHTPGLPDQLVAQYAAQYLATYLSGGENMHPKYRQFKEIADGIAAAIQVCKDDNEEDRE